MNPGVDSAHVVNLCGAASIQRRVNVVSSMISEIGYDPASQVLEVKFSNTGVLYRYPKISEVDFARLLNAKSIGEHFTSYIKARLCCTWVDHANKKEKA